MRIFRLNFPVKRHIIILCHYIWCHNRGGNLSKIEKLINRMRSNPSDATFEEVKKYLEYYGFILDRTNGSHHIFIHEKISDELVIPTIGGRFVKTIYVKEANRVIDKLEDE